LPNAILTNSLKKIYKYQNKLSSSSRISNSCSKTNLSTSHNTIPPNSSPISSRKHKYSPISPFPEKPCSRKWEKW
jgi:hypothetical protein